MAGESVIMSWSGGKDSTLALERILTRRGWKVDTLLTTVSEVYDRISIHGVRRALLYAQADALGLPVEEAILPAEASNTIYEEAFAAAIARIQDRKPGVRRIVFGDLFLEDIRRWRIEQVGKLGLEAVFPLWGEPTRELADDFLRRGFHAWVACVDSARLPPETAGQAYDQEFLRLLPANVDPCGERGEFHTFVDAGPLFSRPVPVRPGKRVARGGYVYADLVPPEVPLT